MFLKLVEEKGLHMKGKKHGGVGELAFGRMFLFGSKRQVSGEAHDVFFSELLVIATRSQM